MCPAAECDISVALWGLGEIIHSVGAVAVLCKGGKNPRIKNVF